MTEERCACGHLHEHHAGALEEGWCGLCRLRPERCEGYCSALCFAGHTERVSVTRREIHAAAYRELAGLGHAERVRVSLAIAKAIAGPDRG